MKDGLYCDGGTVGKNPSPVGGTWAWCLVQDGLIIKSAHGAVEPGDLGVLKVSNNVAELLAAVLGLASAHHPGRKRTLFTDSGVTRFRLTTSDKFNGVPDWLRERTLTLRKSLTEESVILLGGHPSKLDLLRGHRSDGKPVSDFNVWCDRKCQEAGARLLSLLGGG